MDDPIIHIIPSREEEFRRLLNLFSPETKKTEADIVVMIVKRPKVEMAPWMIAR